MTLPASGNLSLREVIEEVYGVGIAGSKSLVNCFNDADPAVSGGTLPVSIRDFLSHTQSWGRSYSELGISYTAYIKRISNGTRYLMDSGPSLEFTADRNESLAVYKDVSDTPIGAGEAITLKLYRRTKQSSDAWTLDTTLNSYTSGSFSCAFNTYDYKIRLEPNP